MALEDETLRVFLRHTVPPAGPLEEYIISEEMHENLRKRVDLESERGMDEERLNRLFDSPLAGEQTMEKEEQNESKDEL